MGRGACPFGSFFLDLQVTLSCTMELTVRGAGMSKFMSIQEFSDCTGISKSPIRYYESVNLLSYVTRDSSGYRVYSKGQVETINVITSLRLADVPIKDIQAHLNETDEQLRNEMVNFWVQSIKERLNVLSVGLQYLESDKELEQIYLVEKSPETIIWFAAQSKVGQFKEPMNEKIKELKSLGVPIKSCYLKYLSGRNVIKAHIGFIVSESIDAAEIKGCIDMEQMPAALCLALPFSGPFSSIQSGFTLNFHGKLLVIAIYEIHDPS
ncbi:MerR family transcriptional regulator [Sutcliffiella horikoshii]|uniref:MerR family transcriptional regulator n=1 Tax=Sutcliffiella horikoshii TaxID=79883 RepID=A0A5D4T0M8_9BACI|nr:MerR family transcriptional regulator [Sutcliffiella horikoshii]TYS67656.1 MerR family transcriptional regulator [Sutcliffiella horikoshii]